MQYQRLTSALQRSATELGVCPELASLRPQLSVHIFETLPSTNQEAWKRIEQGQGAGTVIIARQQTAGRGQWGRTWTSTRGGLYLSLILEPDCAIADASLLTLATAWGIAASCNNLGIPMAIKWPNDLVSRGSKVGGILTESRITKACQVEKSASSSQLSYAVVGVGLNWENTLPPNAISIRQLLPDNTRDLVKNLETLAAIALRGIFQGHYYWQQQGNGPLIRAYQQKMAHLGKKIVIDGRPALVTGVSTTGDLTVDINLGSGRKYTRSLKPGEISLGYDSAS